MYGVRFSWKSGTIRKEVWSVLVEDCFGRHVRARRLRDLDLGCGYGEFINQVRLPSEIRHGPESGYAALPLTGRHLSRTGLFNVAGDCPDASLDVVFTSNFFEHLPDKAALGLTLDEIVRCLQPEGRLDRHGTEYQVPARSVLGFLGPLRADHRASPEGSASVHGDFAIDIVRREIPSLHDGERPEVSAVVLPRLSSHTIRLAYFWQAVSRRGHKASTRPAIVALL